MEDKNYINSGQYWDARFVGDWESFQGPAQSRFFARLAIENLPRWLIEQLQRQPLTLVDWGCAQGDGTDVWASYVDPQRLVGVDFSPVAIEQAAKRYPAMRFINEDWLTGQPIRQEDFDVVFSSNTLEHFHKPYDVLKILCGRARKALVLALPYREMNRHQEHFYTFLPDNIPSVIDAGFRLVWSRVVDCRQLPDTLWGGDQIVLVYAEFSWVESLRLTLRDICIEQTNLAVEIDSLNEAVVQRDGQINSLNQAVIEREGQIASLNQAVAERDGQLHSAHLYKVDRETYIAMLKFELEKFNSRIDQKTLRFLNRLKRLPYFAMRSVAIIRSQGFSGLRDAVAFKLQNRAAGNRNSYLQPSVSVSLATTDTSPKRYTQPLLGDALVIVTGVPFDDVGGGQRAAQLARCALKTGRMVVFLYVYKKFDFELNRHIESEVLLPGLVHKFIGTTSPTEILSLVSPDATLLLEFPHKEALPYLQLFKSRGMRTVFELIDDWESSLGGDWFNLQIYHRFVYEAQFVVGTAKVLVKKLQELGRNDAMYLPNAANEYIFDKYKKYERPSDLPRTSRRIALYFGSLYGDWFGWDYLKEAAEKNSDMEFILIGDKPNDQSLPSLPSNVYFLGGKKIEELPAYLAHSDVGLLPFSPGKISDAVSPIKIFEYLFSETPVVATKLPEIVGYPGVSIANSPDEFSSLCKVVNFSDELRRENDRFIFENSWFSRLENFTTLGKDGEFKNMTSVIILIHNNKSIIGRCLESLLFHSAPYLREVIVVDNASVDGGADFVEEKFPSVKVIRNPVNGCSSGRNLGAKFASGKFLAFFDSDQWFTSSSCFREALGILNRDANVGAVAWGAGWFETGRDDLGGMIADFCPNRAMNDIAIQRGYRSDVGYLATCGFFVPRAVFDSTEGFDVAYDPTCFEDTDMSFQIKKLGFDVCYRDLTGIRHQPHQTTQASSGSDTYRKLFKRNAVYFKKKWAAHPQFFVDYVN